MNDPVWITLRAVLADAYLDNLLAHRARNDRIDYFDVEAILRVVHLVYQNPADEERLRREARVQAEENFANA